MSKKQTFFSRVASSSNQFSRILPKKMHHDKQHLYSEMLQLKQNHNETVQENIRLKTKISILEKQKTKINKYFQANHDGLSSKANSRANLLGSRAHDKDNLIIMNLKKIVRESNELNEFLKGENIKIKKNIKYTKINEMQIEKKILYDENKKLGGMIGEYNDRYIDQEGLSVENSELKRFLEDEIEENKILSEQNERYEELLENLKKQFEVQVQKLMNREKKLLRDLALEKRKVQENQRYVQNLKGQVKNLQNNQTQLLQTKKKASKTLIRLTTSMPYRKHEASVSNHLKNESLANKMIKVDANQPQIHSKQDLLQKEQTQKIKQRNEQLQKQLKEVKLKLNKNQNQLQKIKIENVPQKKRESVKEVIKESTITSNTKIRNKIELEDKKQKTQENNSNIYKNQFQEEESTVYNKKEELKVKQKKKYEEEQDQYLKEFQEGSKEEEDYEQIFDKKSDLMEYGHDGKKKEIRKSVLEAQVEEKDEQEEIFYKKEETKKNQQTSEKVSEKKKKKKNDKAEKGEKVEKGEKKVQDHKYKPNKKILSQIKQLLTYRMKAQRYPFSDLKNDIQSAEASQFTWADLSDMLINEPFFLTPSYTKIFLQYCYQKQKIDKDEILHGDKVLEKLRKVIEEFQLLNEQEQKEMIVRIAEMTSTYPEQLQSAFQQIKNGEQTVTRANLIEMFSKLQLEPNYIELIISELSLCSTDLEHLNFYGFFERFYLEDGGKDGQEQEEQPDNNPIIEQEESEQSYRQNNKPKKPVINKESQDEDNQYAIRSYKMNSGNILQKAAVFDDEDIVSDDGRN